MEEFEEMKEDLEVLEYDLKDCLNTTHSLQKQLERVMKKCQKKKK